MTTTRLVAALSLVVASCSAPGFEAPTFDRAGVLPDGPSALLTPDHPDLPDPAVDPDDLVSGGPPPDGIPSIGGNTAPVVPRDWTTQQEVQHGHNHSCPGPAVVDR
jgi:hypothetical protein